ncbi:hypothetical protein DH2020_042804 [Rehmannia glutinosa]|uniref:Pectinesterase inhibitor domain-containing protein n=1 Tax=Rehmannia glutinosa TaxID=99300 RepID=A0ABR0ULL5_REHGL
MSKSLHMNYSSSYVYMILNLVLLISGKLFVSATLLEDVCRQTHDQAFCLNVLGSDPRTQNADLVNLGLITIDLGSYSATGTKIKIHSLLLSEKDPLLKSRFVMCDEYYEDAIAYLRDAADYLKRGEYSDIAGFGGVAYNDAYECENAFKKPPGFKSPLTDENYRLEQFCEIITIIGNMLLVKKAY